MQNKTLRVSDCFSNLRSTKSETKHVNCILVLYRKTSSHEFVILVTVPHAGKCTRTAPHSARRNKREEARNWTKSYCTHSVLLCENCLYYIYHS